MIVTDQIKCDVCDVAKGETNHWLMVAESTDSSLRAIVFAPIDTREELDGDQDFKVGHLCGHACAHARLSQFLELLTA